MPFSFRISQFVLRIVVQKPIVYIYFTNQFQFLTVIFNFTGKLSVIYWRAQVNYHYPTLILTNDGSSLSSKLKERETVENWGTQNADDSHSEKAQGEHEPAQPLVIVSVSSAENHLIYFQIIRIPGAYFTKKHLLSLSNANSLSWQRILDFFLFHKATANSVTFGQKSSTLTVNFDSNTYFTKRHRQRCRRLCCQNSLSLIFVFHKATASWKGRGDIDSDF